MIAARHGRMYRLMPLTVRDIQSALRLPPLGGRSDFDLNPEARAELMPDEAQRPAAVLCPLIERVPGLHVVLTRRATHLRRHAGQIAFPGGRIDAEDASPLSAALREAKEEIGLHPEQVEILGALDPYVTSSAFRVTPFVGLVAPDWQPAADPDEVEEIFEVPLDFLMDPANRERHHRKWQGRWRDYYAMPFGEYYIWGATAGMLKGLSDRLGLLAEQGAA